jgi:hypothetical protein
VGLLHACRRYSRGIGQIVNKGAVTTMAAETQTMVFEALPATSTPRQPR